MPPSILARLQDPDRQALEELLSDSVRFHSPVADYEGRGDVAHLLSLIATVLEDLRLTRAIASSGSRTSFMDAVVGGRPAQGVLDERLDEFGQVVEATLMLRPLSALHAAVDAMAQALHREPLPSQGGRSMADNDGYPRPGQPVRGSRTGRPIMVLLDLVGRRWTLRVMWELHRSGPEPLTFRGLQDRCGAMSSSVLNRRLRELRDAGLVARRAGGYALAPMGADLVLLLTPLDAWAQRWSSGAGAPPGSGEDEEEEPDPENDRR